MHGNERVLFCTSISCCYIDCVFPNGGSGNRAALFFLSFLLYVRSCAVPCAPQDEFTDDSNAVIDDVHGDESALPAGDSSSSGSDASSEEDSASEDEKGIESDKDVVADMADAVVARASSAASEVVARVDDIAGRALDALDDDPDDIVWSDEPIEPFWMWLWNRSSVGYGVQLSYWVSSKFLMYVGRNVGAAGIRVLTASIFLGAPLIMAYKMHLDTLYIAELRRIRFQEATTQSYFNYMRYFENIDVYGPRNVSESRIAGADVDPYVAAATRFGHEPGEVVRRADKELGGTLDAMTQYARGAEAMGRRT